MTGVLAGGGGCGCCVADNSHRFIVDRRFPSSDERPWAYRGPSGGDSGVEWTGMGLSAVFATAVAVSFICTIDPASHPCKVDPDDDRYILC